MVNVSPEAVDLGYILYPRRRPHEPGYPRLDVILRTKPTGHHFDPLKVHLTVTLPEGGITPLVVEHPWSDLEDYVVCAGKVELIDRNNKHLDAFTFGGAMHIQPEEDHSVLILNSPAPILLSAESSLEHLLIDECEIILAERKAIRESERGLFERHLKNAPPLELYRALLIAILERYQHLPPNEDELVFKLEHTLRTEIEAVEGQLPVLNRRRIEGLL